MNRATHWAELTDFGAVLTNTTLVVAFVHMSTAADCGSVQRRVLELPLPADVKRLLVTAQRFGTSPIVRV